MQAQAYLSDTDSNESKELKTHRKLKNRKLRKNPNQDDEEQRASSDLDNDKSAMSSSSSDSSSSISFSSDSSASAKTKRRKRSRKKTKSSSSDSSSDSSSSLSISSSDLSFSESDSEPPTAKQQHLEEGEIDDPEPRSTPISPSRGLAQFKKYKSQLSRLRKKAKSMEKSVKHVARKLRQHPSSKRSRQKKKMEKKLAAYKSRMSGLVSRQNCLLDQNPRLNDHLSPKRKSKSKKKCSKRKADKKSPGPANQVKVPYPVLNDKREMSLIKEILEEKQQNLGAMLNKICKTLQNQNETKPVAQENEQKKARLNILKDNIQIQLQRLSRQLEYVKLHIEMEKLQSRVASEASIDQRNELNRRLLDLKRLNEDLTSLMKEANRQYLHPAEKKESESRPVKAEAKSEPVPVTVSAHPVNYRQTNAVQPAAKAHNLNSMTPPTSSASSSSSSSSISLRPQQAFPRSQVKTPPLPAGSQSVHNQPNVPRFAKVNGRNAECEVKRASGSRFSTSPHNSNQSGFKNARMSGGSQVPNFENMFQNAQFIQSMMSMASDEVGNGLLPCPQKSTRHDDEQKSNMFSMFEQYFNKFASGMGLGHMSQSQVYSLFETMQQSGNLSFASQMMMGSPQMAGSHGQFGSARQPNGARFNHNSNFNTNKQTCMNDFRFNKRNNSNLDNCHNKRQRY
ncbi:hypothetical protein BpHYR1_014862 [Brachionus plicatilis]|uniref:Uncharacterized protein n=1 Tax=Brachionus plicatilis TaxID=10195 RepID=A0A3M7Q613_BRAPC|nr:hypothetical protein BpHYR1_014862 [Brachionus plicatilis]